MFCYYLSFQVLILLIHAASQIQNFCHSNVKSAPPDKRSMMRWDSLPFAFWSASPRTKFGTIIYAQVVKANDIMNPVLSSWTKLEKGRWHIPVTDDSEFLNEAQPKVASSKAKC